MVLSSDPGPRRDLDQVEQVVRARQTASALTGCRLVNRWTFRIRSDRWEKVLSLEYVQHYVTVGTNNSLPNAS